MSTACSPIPWLIPVPGAACGPGDDTDLDPDDGIHVVSVTPVERPYGPALLVVIAWIEEGRTVERVLELPR